MKFDLEKMYYKDGFEMARALDYIDKTWRPSNHIEVANKSAETILCTFIANYYYEREIAKYLGLTNQPDYKYIDTEHTFADCVIDTVEGVEIKTTKWDFGKTVRYNNEHYPNWLHNANKVAIYDTVTHTLYFWDRIENTVSPIENLNIEFDWSYYMCFIMNSKLQDLIKIQKI